MPTRSIVALFPLLLGGCMASASPAPAYHRGTYSPITEEEIAQLDATDLYTVIQSARPRWLVTQQSKTDLNNDEIVVYYGRVKLGGLAELRSIATGNAAGVYFLRPARAQMLLGNGHVSGAIMVEPAVQ